MTPRQRPETDKVTLRDLMDLKDWMNCEFTKIRSDVSNERTRNSLTSGAVAVILSALVIVFSKLLHL